MHSTLPRMHVNFGGQRMKVSVVAQRLSRSVALALIMLKEVGYQQFKDCSPTIKFEVHSISG